MKIKTYALMALLCLCYSYAYSQITMQSLADSDSVKVNFAHAIEEVFEGVDLSLVPSGVLYERGVSFIDMTSLTGQSDTIKTNLISFSLAYASISTMAVDSLAVLPDPSSYRNKMDTISPNSSVILVAGLHQKYNYIDTTAIDDSLFTKSGNNLTDVYPRDRSPYLEREVFIFAPCERIVNRPNFTLRFDSELFYNNTGETIDSAWIDLGNGGGYSLFEFDEDLQIANTEGGDIEFKCKFKYSDGSTYYSSFDIATEASVYSTLGTPDIVHTISPTFTMDPAEGNGGGYVNVYLSCGHEDIEKPFIWAEAYNPTVGSIDANLTPQDIIDRMNHTQTIQVGDDKRLLEYLLENGYDIIVLDYAHGGDYLPRTSEFIKSAIGWVNDRKHANGSNAKNVILGQSMGGVATTLALKEIEDDGTVDHEVDQFIIFDSPIMGVNIPLSAQACLLDISMMWVDHPFPWEDDKFLFQYVEFLEDIIDILYLPATKTMVSLQCNDITLQGTDTPIPTILSLLFGKDVNSYYYDFYDYLHNDLGGLPTQCEVLTITSGSKYGIDGQQPYEPGELVVEAGINNITVASLIGFWLSDAIMEGSLTLFEAEEVYGNYGLTMWEAGLEMYTSIKLYAMKDQPDFKYFSNEIELYHWWFDLAMILHDNSATKTDGVEIDNAPGGFFGIENNGIILDETELGPLTPSTFKLQTWCFTPTGSVLNYHGVWDETWMDEPLRSYTSPVTDLEDNLLKGVTNYVSNKETPNFGTLVNYNNTAHTWFTRESSRFMRYQLIGSDELIGTSTLSSGETYNFGQSALDEEVNFETSLPVRTSSILGHSLLVDGTLLKVNNNGMIGLSPSPYLPNELGDAKANSHFVVHIGPICEDDPSVVLTIDEGAELIIGDGSTRTGSVLVQDGHAIDVKDGGTILIKSGSTLKLNAGGLLDIRDGATIIIEDGANFITEEGSLVNYHQGGEIQLNGSESLMELGGVLHLEENANLIPKHDGVPSGTIVITGSSGVLDGETGSSFEIIGDNSSDPMLVIQEGGRFVSNSSMELLRVSNCKVLLRSFEGNQLQSFSPYHSYNVKYEIQSNLSDVEFRPYISFNNKTHISGCSFEDITVYGELFTVLDGTFFRCINTDFTSNFKKEYLQLRITGGSSLIRLCNFTDFEGVALALEEETATTVVELCTFESDNLETSSAIASRSHSELIVRNSDFDHCSAGVVKRHGKLSLRCNTFYDMDHNGVFAGSYAWLNMSTNDNAGYNYFSAMGEYHIETIEAHNIHLNYGYNTLIEAGGMAVPTITGDLEIEGPFLTTILANQNQWNYSPVTPYPIEFDLVSSVTGLPISVATPTIGSGSCGAADPDTPIFDYPGTGGGSYLPSVPIYGESEDMRLDSAIANASSSRMLSDSAGSDLLAINQFHDILTYQYSEQELKDTAVLFYLDFAYQMMKYTVSHAINDSIILPSNNTNSFSTPVQKYVNVLNTLSKGDTIGQNEYVRGFHIEIDKANLLRSLGHTSSGLNILQNINLCPLDSSEQQILNDLMFEYNEEITKRSIGVEAYFSDTIYTDTTTYFQAVPLQITESYFGSVINGPNSITYRACSGSKAPEKTQDVDLGTIFSLYPNPSNGIITIEYNVPDNSIGTLNVYSIDGKVVKTFNLNQGSNVEVIDISHVPSGLYIYQFFINEEIESSGRISIAQ